MTGLEACAQILNLRDGVIPEFGIVIVGLLKEDGNSAYSFAAFNRPDAATVLGVLDMVKMDVHYRTKDPREYDD
jgi:hypothetical protein